MVVESYTFTNLDKEKYVSLTTFRKTGKAVTTPVWLAESMGTIYTETGVNAGKLKRIRHTERVTLAACTLSGKVKGSEVEGKARVVSEPQEIHEVRAATSKKSRLPRSIYYFLLNTISTMLRKPRMNLVYIAIDSVTITTLSLIWHSNIDQRTGKFFVVK
jgi:PPOX class probable F420-dependent enzyme